MFFSVYETFYAKNDHLDCNHCTVCNHNDTLSKYAYGGYFKMMKNHIFSIVTVSSITALPTINSMYT